MWDWLNCAVLARHEFSVWCEDGSIFLRCLRCGHRSQGWDVEDHADHRESLDPRAPQRIPVVVRHHA